MMPKGEILETTQAISGKRIRLTLKQWLHVVESHDYMAGNMSYVLETLNSPDYIVRGSKGALIALKYYSHTNLAKNIVW